MVSSLLLACIIGTLYVSIQAVSTNDEQRLAAHLLKQYGEAGPQGRPVEQASQAWNITFGISLQSIQRLDYSSQTIELLLWYNLAWTDHHLKWDRSEFDVQSIRLKPTDIIMPDVVLYNTAAKTEMLNPYDPLVIYYDGQVNYVPQVRQKALCSMPASFNSGSANITCALKFGSWTYDGSKLNPLMRGDNIDLSNYMEHPYWDLTDSSASRAVKLYECCPEPYIDIEYVMTLTKK